MDGARHGQALSEHTFPEHVAGGLVFEAVHALVEVAGCPIRTFAFGLCIVPIRAREAAHEQARFARHGIPAAGLVNLAIGPHVRSEVVAPERLERRNRLRLRQDARQPDLESPALAEDLVDLAARA